MAKSDRVLASEILELVGGKDNINSVVHCATRLRFKLKDESLANIGKFQELDGVIKALSSGGQFQVVIGTHVGAIHQQIIEITGDIKTDDASVSRSSFIDVVSSIFTPFLGVLAGTAMIKGLLSIISFVYPEFATTGAYVILNAAGDGFFRFLPILLAYTTAKKFKTNEFLAMALAMALVYPIGDIEGFNFFGIPVVYSGAIGYYSTVLPIIIAVLIQSKVEKFAKRITPKILVFGVTMITLLIMVPLTFIVIGPLGLVIGAVLRYGIEALYAFSPVVTGLILGAMWQTTVIFGIHWGFVPIVIEGLGSVGYDVLLPLVIPAVIAQAGACLAVALRTRDKSLKSIAVSSSVAAIFGITEPAVYGVTLPLKKPFVFASIGGSIGGALAGFFGVKVFAFSVSALAIPNMIGRNGIESSAEVGALAMVLAFIIGFVLTYMFGVKGSSRVIFNSPLKGKVLPLSEVDDKVFSSGLMGQGVAVEPAVGETYAPIDGKVTVLMPSKHAIGITTDDGIELLIHIGIDTVELGGEGFVSHVKQGDRINRGDRLVSFDMDAIKKAGKPCIVIVVVTNSVACSSIQLTDKSIVDISDVLVKVKK